MAVTAVYEYPITGVAPSPLAPTAVQVADRVTFTLNDVVSADASVTVVHNMGFNTAELAAGFPIVVMQPLRASARTSQWIIGSAALPGDTGKAANSIDLTRVVGAGDTGTAVAQIRIHLLRPHTIGR
jgi:hypothetical protein